MSTNPCHDTPDAPPRAVVQVVDDAPESLGFVCDALDAAGYTVLVARSGEDALDGLRLVVPDAVLMDAVMPGLDGFETCRRLKADPALSHVSVIFMTGLAETSHIVEGFAAGGVDYVVKPVKIEEVLARVGTHLRNARVTRLAREAVDVGGHGVLLIDAQGRIAWRSPRAAAWLAHYGIDTAQPRLANGQHLGRREGRELHARRLGAAGPGEIMWLLDERAAGQDTGSRLASASLTPRETEVLSWLAKGKTNRDIADILGMSHRTVNKHLEHIFEKLGVETRAAAVAVASARDAFLAR